MLGKVRILTAVLTLISAAPIGEAWTIGDAITGAGEP